MKPIKVKLPNCEVVRKYLESKPGEVFITRDVAQATGLADSSIADQFRFLPNYTLNVGRNRYWGCPAAIKELRKQVSC